MNGSMSATGSPRTGSYYGWAAGPACLRAWRPEGYSGIRGCSCLIRGMGEADPPPRHHSYRHTEHVPPSLEQCLQYRQFLQARQMPVGLQVPACASWTMGSPTVRPAVRSKLTIISL